MMLPADAVEALDEARVWAEYRDELEALAARGWQFSRTASGGFSAAHPGRNGRNDRRLFSNELGELIKRASSS